MDNKTFIVTPDIPCPRPDDKEFNKTVRRWLDTRDALNDMRGQRDTWRRAFYAVAVMLFAFLIALLVLCGSRFCTPDGETVGHTDSGSKFFTLHSSLFT